MADFPLLAEHDSRKRTKLNMKKILSLIGVASLLTTTGCLVPVSSGHGHGHYEHQSTVAVPAAVVVVPLVPVIQVHD